MAGFFLALAALTTLAVLAENRHDWDEATALLSARERHQLTELVGRVKRRLQTMTEAQPEAAPSLASRPKRAARR